MTAQRRALASAGVVAAALAAGFAAACASLSENGAAPGDDGGSPGPDGSTDGGTDGGGMGDTGPPGDASTGPTSVTFLWAGSGDPSVRVCWNPTDSAFPPAGTPMPASNYAGIPLGGAALLADARELTAGAFTLYVVDALAAKKSETLSHAKVSCGSLACPGPAPSTCVGAGNYAQIDGVQALDQGFPWLLVLGGAWPNVQAQAIELTPDPAPAPGMLNVQAALATGGLTGATVTFGAADAGDDGGGFAASLSGAQPVAPMFPAAVAYGGATDEQAFATEGFAVTATTGDGGAATQWMSLAQSLSLVAPTADPRAYYGQRAAFVVAVAGDPSAPPFPGSDAGAYDGTGLHILVLPTTITGQTP